jgi:hypothetical protein
MVTIKNNPEWEGIIENDVVVLKVETNFVVVMQVLDIMLVRFKCLEGVFVEMLWKLVSAPLAVIHCKCGELLMKVNCIAANIG